MARCSRHASQTRATALAYNAGARSWSGTRSLEGSMIRLGRISYVNMAPVFHRLEAEVEEVHGRPDRARRAQLLAGEVDVAPIPSIEWARNAGAAPDPSPVRRCRRRGRSTRSSSSRAHPALTGSARLGSPPRAPPRSSSSASCCPKAEHVALEREGGREAPDRRRCAAERVRGPDSASRPRPALAGAHGPSDGLCGLRLRRSAARGRSRSRGRPARIAQAEPC